MVTGFEIHGTFSFFGFEKAVSIHNTAGITWLVAFAFFTFWVFTTGEWKQYIPTTKKMLEVIRYYMIGIFRGEKHPFAKRKEAKHNPLQRLTYIFLAVIMLPVQMITGLVYWGYNEWTSVGMGSLSLEVIAVLHLAVAFLLVSFVIVHVYMTTTGHNLTAHVKAMITGWEDIEEDTVIEDWEKAKS